MDCLYAEKPNGRRSDDVLLATPLLNRLSTKGRIMNTPEDHIFMKMLHDFLNEHKPSQSAITGAIDALHELRDDEPTYDLPADCFYNRLVDTVKFIENSKTEF
jgi:hypothetical protein